MSEVKQVESGANKPGYKTTEFWINAVAMIAGIILASGAIAEGGMIAQIVGGVMASLGGASYTAGRSVIKKKQAELSK